MLREHGVLLISLASIGRDGVCGASWLATPGTVIRDDPPHQAWASVAPAHMCTHSCAHTHVAIHTHAHLPHTQTHKKIILTLPTEDVKLSYDNLGGLREDISFTVLKGGMGIHRRSTILICMGN